MTVGGGGAGLFELVFLSFADLRPEEFATKVVILGQCEIHYFTRFSGAAVFLQYIYSKYIYIQLIKPVKRGLHLIRMGEIGDRMASKALQYVNSTCWR